MERSEMDHVISKIKALTALPSAVQKLCALPDASDTDIQEIIDIISKDEALTTRLLRVVNSSFYGFSRKVGTISQAVVILGFKGVKNLALGVSLFGLQNGVRHEPPLDREEFWRHSLAVATASKMLGEKLGLKNPDEAFISGLIHDIGKIVFLEYFPDEYAGILKNVGDGVGKLNALEKDVFGVSHALVGRKLCQYWKLPESLARPVGLHHLPLAKLASGTQHHRAALIVAIANNLAKISQIGYAGDPYADAAMPDMPAGRREFQKHLMQIIFALPEEIRKVEIFFALASESDGAVHAEDFAAPVVCVRLDDAKMRSIVHYTLVAMGYTVVQSDPFRKNPGDLIGVVGAASDAGPLKALCDRRAVPFLDLDKYLGENRAAAADCVHVPLLRAWLASGFRPHAS